MATLEGADKDFANKVNNFIGSHAGTGLTSGYRDPAQQTKLWNDALKKYGSPEAARKWVAPPEGAIPGAKGSNHSHGFAADLSGINNVTDAELAANGLYRPMKWEPWHVEPLGHRGDKKSYTIPPNADPATHEVMEQFEEQLTSLGVGQQASTVGAPQSSVDTLATSVAGNPRIEDIEVATKTPQISNMPATGGAANLSPDASSAVIGQVKGLNPEQMQNAAEIIRVGRSRGISDKGLEIAIATAMQESGLRNLNYGDRDSKGLFQQRPSQGWGTVAQVTNPAYAANKFFDHLVGLDYNNMPLTVAAQKVQRSAYPNAYAKHEATARNVVGSIR